MKYYIPTSSLNFNNILSTESISPKAFYARRGFGYNRWFVVEENKLDKVTLLYDTPHEFKRPVSDMEDHAMLIEIITDDVFPTISKGVFYTDKTIYLNPWQTKFYFFSEKVKRTVKSLSDSSLETKVVRLYQRQMLVSHFDGMYSANIDPVSVSEEKILRNVEEDIIINKMKGLLYGYYIGANLSTSKDNILRLDSLREIQNIFSSVISSYDKIPSEAQKKRLDDLFNILERQNPLYLDLKRVVGNHQLVENIINLLKRYGHNLRLFDGEYLINALQSNDDYNPSITWVNNEIKKAEATADSTRKLLSPDDEEIIVSSSEKVISQKAIVDEQLAEIYKCWMNKVLCSPTYNGKISSIKEILSDEITKAAKNIIGADWDNSPIRSYLNLLRRHLRGEEFNPKWDNGLLSSMAAVLSKGDDWEQLLFFMQSKGMYDYRIAFSIYGVLNGFANLTRDFTDLLLTKDYNYLSGVYHEFFGQLHEKDIPMTMIPTEIITEVIKPSKQNSRFSSLEEENQGVHKNQWRDEILMFAKTIVKRDKQKLLNSLEEAFRQNGDNRDLFNFITLLGSFDGWKLGNTPWKKMQEHFVPDYDTRAGKDGKKMSSKKGKLDAYPSLFDDQQVSIEAAPAKTKLFFEDDYAWSHIESIVPKSDKQKLFNDLKWFQTEMRKPKDERYKYYQDLDTSNNEVLIDKFCHLKEKPDKNGHILAPYFTESLRHKIKEILNRVYCE